MYECKVRVQDNYEPNSELGKDFCFGIIDGDLNIVTKTDEGFTKQPWSLMSDEEKQEI